MTLANLPGKVWATIVNELVAKQALPNAFTQRISKAVQKKGEPEGIVRSRLKNYWKDA